MANCSSCSAPLSGPSTICEYCGRRNDVDLRGIHKYTQVKPDSERSCPRCNVPLHTINLKKDDRFYIERCNQCMGLFFDPNELEALLDDSVSHVFNIDLKRLDTITKELYFNDDEHRLYIKCPVCSEFMKRTNFGTKSGVIIDRCPKHGIWLDGGELKRLLEWKKAGGQMLHEQRNSDTKDQTINKSNHYGYSNAGGNAEGLADGILNQARSKRTTGSNHWGGHQQDGDIVRALFRIIDRLF